MKKAADMDEFVMWLAARLRFGGKPEHSQLAASQATQPGSDNDNSTWI